MAHKSIVLIVVAAVFAGALGALTPGCYEDWSFVRTARLGQQTQLEQRLKAALEENAKLKGQGGK